MFDRFMVPIYCFWPIAFIGFILIFFIPIYPKVELNNKYVNITSEINSNLIIKSNNLLLENITQECITFIDNIEDENNMKLISKFNLTIKITIIILFGFTVIFMIVAYCLVKGGGCYDEDYGGYCQTWEDTFSCNTSDDEKVAKLALVSIILFFLICTGIVVLSIMSVKYESGFEQNILDTCGFIIDEDYEISYWKAAKIILPIISSFYLIEIILCIYSLCYVIIKFR